jgi:serine/threonine-protein kinase HipA
MQRKGKVYYKNSYAGVVWQDEDGYGFHYAEEYLHKVDAAPVSLTLPLRKDPFFQPTMLPFFYGLIPKSVKIRVPKHLDE